MVDAVFALIIFYSLVLGARRGFFKEVVQTVALVLSVLLAAQLRVPAGASLHGMTGLPVLLAEVAAVVVVWAGSFFAIAVIGRLVLKKLRGRGVDDNLDEGAEGLADALAGDTSKGPVTLLTDPIASKTGVFYWSDKVLGAGLGSVKGLATGYIFFGLLIYADRARGWDSPLVGSFETSYANRLFEAQIQPHLETYPAYRIARSLGEMSDVADAVMDDPRRFVTLIEHPELKGLREDERLIELGKNPEVRKAWMARDVQALLMHEEVRALLGDPELRALVADVDWSAVRADVDGVTPLSGEVVLDEATKRALEELGTGLDGLVRPADEGSRDGGAGGAGRDGGDGGGADAERRSIGVPEIPAW